MNTSREALISARELQRAHDHSGALAALNDAHARYPEDPDVAADLGILLCYLQREVGAVDLLERSLGAEQHERLARILTNHLHCRSLMAVRANLADEPGRVLRERVAKTLALEPAEVGVALSACLIVRDEESHLERCLRSLAGHVDEIVVIDTGSTDRTVEIAEEFGAKIGHFAWCDDFSAARNESLALATGNWALWIDADEEVEATSWGAIREGLMRPQFGGYFVEIVNFMSEEHEGAKYVHSPVRLFQRLPGILFEGRIHEQVVPSLDRLGLPSASLKDVRLYHYGYRPSEMATKGKTERTIRLLEKEVRETPTDSFHWFNLANAYSVARRPSDAIRAARVSLQHLDPKNAFGSLAHQILSSALTSTGKPEQALEACQQAEKSGHFTKLTAFERAHALYRLRRYAEALQAVEHCLSLAWPDGMTGDYGIQTHKTHALKGQILIELDRLEESLELFGHALSVDPGFAPAWYGKGVAQARAGNHADAIESLAQAFGDLDFGHPSQKAAGVSAMSIGLEAEAADYFEGAWRARPDDVAAWVRWVQILEKRGDVPAMLGAYEDFSQRHEPNADVLVNWGRALEASGESERALQCFTEAVKREPDHPNAYFNAGDLLYRHGQFADAAHLYESGLRHDPKNVEGWFVLGNSLAQVGLPDGATLAFGQALALDPSHAGALHNLEVVASHLDEAA